MFPLLLWVRDFNSPYPSHRISQKNPWEMGISSCTESPYPQNRRILSFSLTHISLFFIV